MAGHHKRRRIFRSTILLAIVPPASRAFALVGAPSPLAHVFRPATFGTVSVPTSTRSGISGISVGRVMGTMRGDDWQRRRCESCGSTTVCSCDIERRPRERNRDSHCRSGRRRWSLKLATVEHGERTKHQDNAAVAVPTGGSVHWCSHTREEAVSSECRLRRRLRTIGRLRHPGNVLDLLTATKAREGTISLRIFNAAITAVSACEGGHRPAIQLLALMDGEEGVVPDRFSFTAVVASCCRCQEWRLAHKVLLEMKRRGLRPLHLRTSRFTTTPGETGVTRDKVVRLLQHLRNALHQDLRDSEDGGVGNFSSQDLRDFSTQDFRRSLDQDIQTSSETSVARSQQDFSVFDKYRGIGGGRNSPRDIEKRGQNHNGAHVNGVNSRNGHAEGHGVNGAIHGHVTVNVSSRDYCRQRRHNGLKNINYVWKKLENDGECRAQAGNGIGKGGVGVGVNGKNGAPEVMADRIRIKAVLNDESMPEVYERKSSYPALDHDLVAFESEVTSAATTVTAATLAAAVQGSDVRGVSGAVVGEADVDVNAVVGAGSPPPKDVFLSELKAAASRKDPAMALGILDRMRKAGHSPHQGAYACAIRACGRAGMWQRSLALLEEIRLTGTEPGEGCYVMALKSCALAGRWEKSLEILERMRTVGVVCCSENVYTIAIKACGEAGRWREAIGLLDEMRKDGLPPMETAYTTAMKACGRAGEWRQSLDLFDEMRQMGIPPNENCFTVAIKACTSAGQTEKALSLLGEMRAASAVSTNTAVYRSIIFACCKAGQWAVGLGLLEDARREQLKPETGDLRAVIQACGEAGQYERALSVLEEMRSERMNMRKTGQKLWWVFRECDDQTIKRRAWEIMEVEQTRERLAQRALRNAEARSSGELHATSAVCVAATGVIG